MSWCIYFLTSAIKRFSNFITTKFLVYFSIFCGIILCSVTMCDRKKIDRPPAGFEDKQESHMNEIMEMYDIIESAKYAEKKLTKPKLIYPSAATAYSPQGNIAEHFSIETKKGRFLNFRERFLEELYSKNCQIGCIKPVRAKPDHLNNYNHTYGMKLHPHPRGSNEVIQNDTRKEINRESKKSHEKYLISHKHYLPAEKIKRGYTQTFEPSNRFGIATDAFDVTKVKRIFDAEDNIMIITKRQKDQLIKKFGLAGSKLDKIESGEYRKVFGALPLVTAADVKTVFDNKSPAERNTKLNKTVQYAHQIRLYLARNYHIDIYDFKAELIKCDVERTGYITLDKVQEIANKERLGINVEKLIMALEHFGILKVIDDVQYVNIDDFFNFVTGKISIPYGIPLEKLNKDEYIIDTTYRDMCKDRSTQPLRNAEKYIANPYKNTVQHILYGSSYALQGLTPDDFIVPRTKEEIRQIFSTTINTNFNKLWEKTLTKFKPNNGMLTVGEVIEMMELILQKKVT